MAQLVFGSPEAVAVLKRDAPLRAEAAREARIREARQVVANLANYEVYIEIQRSVMVEAYSEAEAEAIVEKDHLRLDETIISITKQ